MSTRLEMIKRLAVTDDYWKGYLAGMKEAEGASEAQSADFAEHARLLEARLDRATTHRPSFMSDKISMDEARARVRVENAADLSAPRIP